jgi:hypothetical protein
MNAGAEAFEGYGRRISRSLIAMRGRRVRERFGQQIIGL